MLRTFFSSAFFFTVALVHSTTSFAATTKEIAEAFTRRSNQPTFQEMIDAFGGKLPDENPFLTDGFTEAPSITLYDENAWLSEGNRSQAEILAHFIALAELIYPGATWAFLGNDTRLTADPVEAFYLSIGQRDRVVPLTGSGPTIRIDDSGLLAKFLDSAGFDAKNPLSRPPFIILDGTSYTETSQIRYLLKAGYQAYAKNGGKPVDLLTKFNALNTFVRIDFKSGPDILADRDQYLDEQRTHLKTSADPFSSNSHDGIPNQLLGTGNLASMHRNYWHSGYGPIIQDAHGRWIGSTPWEAGADHKRWILAYLYELYQQVSRPEFLPLVQTAAKRLGYEFPLQRPAVGKVYKPKLTPLNQQISALQLDLLENVIRSHGNRSPIRAEPFRQWLHSYATGELQHEILIMVLKQITTLVHSDLLAWNDYRELVVTAIGYYDMENAEFESQFGTLVRTLPILYHVFTNDRKYDQLEWLKNFIRDDILVGTKVALLHDRVVLPIKCERGLVE